MAAAAAEEEPRLLCGRIGCGERYRESENHERACLHHPGPALFHDGLKGWQCCAKRVVSFTDFLDIAGCTRGRHTTQKAEAPEIAVTCPRPSGGAAEEAAEGGGEAGASGSARSQEVDVRAKEEEGDPLEEPDPADAHVEPGQPCLHRGCTYKYKGDHSRREACVYHPGQPLFHEGLKGWTCCKKRVHEFDLFLQIVGCREGAHRFVPPPAPARAVVQCRSDFYQSPARVTLNIYAKKVDRSRSSVRIDAAAVTCRLAFQDGGEYSNTFRLFLPVDPARSSFEFLSTKVEVVLQKESPVEWPALEREDA